MSGWARSVVFTVGVPPEPGISVRLLDGFVLDIYGPDLWDNARAWLEAEGFTDLAAPIAVA